jgi:hypothetical protein
MSFDINPKHQDGTILGRGTKIFLGILVMIIVALFLVGASQIPISPDPTPIRVEVTREVYPQGISVSSGDDALVATLRSVIQTEVAVCCSECDPTLQPSDTPTPYDDPTATPTSTLWIPTDTATATRWIPTNTATPTELVCYQYLIHMPGTPAEQVYCCDSDQCVRGHLYGGHRDAGDYCIDPIRSPYCESEGG